jgi:pyruvate formate lyase activating enzyme
MKIAGLQRVSLIDYPDVLAASVFIAGCNLDCGYCHNRWMIHAEAVEPVITMEGLLEWLATRVGLLDGVVVSGGEPTLYPELGDLLRGIKAAGFQVKLDTNGTRPVQLIALLAEGLLDYVAMDIKAPLDAASYQRVAGRAVEVRALRRSMALLRERAPRYEFRTTVAPGLGVNELEAIADELLADDPWYLQLFVPAEGVRRDIAAQSALGSADLEPLVNRLQQRLTGARLRGD